VKSENSLSEVAKLFSKLGVITFGGAVAHIAMMQKEIVHKRQWMNEEHFLDLMGATNLIPGPNSTEMAMHIGHERAGWKGLIVAGSCFIFPAFIITLFFAWLYKQYGQLPQIQPFIYGIKPTIIAVILASVYPLAKKVLKTVTLRILGIAALMLCLAGYNEIIVMFGAGFIALFLAYFQNKKPGTFVVRIFPFTFLQVSNSTLLSISNVNLFFTFLKIGAVLYGGGYVLFAFLDAELVAKGILSRQQLIDAIAVGQFTPGPITSAVTFIGYQINGFTGAVVSSIGIFLPSFLFVALLNPLVPKIRNSKLFSAFLDAINVASIAIIVTVCYQMGKEGITDWRTILIAIVSLFLSFGFRKINGALLILGGSLIGYLLSFV